VGGENERVHGRERERAKERKGERETQRKKYRKTHISAQERERKEERENRRERERERKREIEIESEKERTREKEKRRETILLHVQYTAVSSDMQLTPASPYPSIFNTNACSPLGKPNAFWAGDCCQGSVPAVSHISKRAAAGTSLNYI